MELDPAAAGRALEYLGIASASLATLHADFVLAFLIGVVGLRRVRRGSWTDQAYASFLAGLNVVLLAAIVFLGLRLALEDWAVFGLGAVAAGLAWIVSGALPLERIPRRLGSSVRGALNLACYRMRRPRIPDQLPRDLRTLGVRHR